VNPPEKFKKKTLCFLKLNAVPIAPGNVNQEVIYGDFGDVPLEHLSVLAQEVFLPMLCNPRNQVGWPEVITKEVVENLHKFIANVYVTIGQTKGKTLLPLPPTDSGAGDKGLRDKDQIHVLESAIVTWTRQIKGVLKTDPEAALKDGLNPGPLTELEFWEDKAPKP
jgi:dynein heavy chain